MARGRERRLATVRDRVPAAAGDFADTNPKRERGSLSTADRVVAPNSKLKRGIRPFGRASRSSSGRWARRDRVRGAEETFGQRGEWSRETRAQRGRDPTHGTTAGLHATGFASFTSSPRVRPCHALRLSAGSRWRAGWDRRRSCAAVSNSGGSALDVSRARAGFAVAQPGNDPNGLDRRRHPA